MKATKTKKRKQRLKTLLKSVFEIFVKYGQIVEQVDHNAVPTSTLKAEELEIKTFF
jgi:hypothetical protein